MKITYLAQHCNDRAGERHPIKEVEDDVLWNWELYDGSVDFRFISFCKDGYIWDHADSPHYRGKHKDHQRIQSQDDTNGWCVLI